jgi:hypothetical protein
VGQYTQRPGQGAGIVITATGVTPEMVRVDFLMAGSCFFISMISVTKSAHTNKRALSFLRKQESIKPSRPGKSAKYYSNTQL